MSEKTAIVVVFDHDPSSDTLEKAFNVDKRKLHSFMNSINLMKNKRLSEKVVKGMTEGLISGNELLYLASVGINELFKRKAMERMLDSSIQSFMIRSKEDFEKLLEELPEDAREQLIASLPDAIRKDLLGE